VRVSISAGFTTEEIREFVHEYQVQRHGQKGAWLVGRGVSYDQLRRWRAAAFEGDLDRGLIPREGSPVTVPPGTRTALAMARERERAAHDAEVARLTARIRELEGTNDALGKAIGLLHAMSEHEPASIPTTTDPDDSSTPRTTSSPS
jgi:transposase-like protein